MNKNRRGFTLLEISLSVALIAILASLSVPVYRTLQTRNDLEVAAHIIVQALRRAQILAQAVDYDMSWGVNIQSGNITIFQGATYASRNAALDESFDIAGNIVSSGLSEIVYAKFSGLPSITGSIILTAVTNETRTISINDQGMLNY